VTKTREEDFIVLSRAMSNGEKERTKARLQAFSTFKIRMNLLDKLFNAMGRRAN